MGICQRKEDGDVEMKGVNKFRNHWRARYQSKDTGVIEKVFKTKEEAENQREIWEKTFGVPNPHKERVTLRKDYSDFEDEDFKIIGDTGESDGSGRQKVLALNKHNGHYEVHTAISIISKTITGKSNTESAKNKVKKRKYYTKNKDKYAFKININGYQHYKGNFQTEQEVIEYRDKFLKEHDLI